MAFSIRCPHCGQIFEEDESHFASIVAQVRDKEFARAVQQQATALEAERKSAVEAAIAQTRAEERARAQEARDQAQAQAQEQQAQAARAAAAQDERIAKLSAQLEASAQERQLAIDNACADATHEAQALRAQLEAQQREQQLELDNAAARARQQEQELRAQIAALRQEQELAVSQATAQAREELLQLRAQLAATEQANQLQVAQAVSEKDARIASLTQQMQATEQAAATRQELAVAQATAQVEREREEALHSVERERDEALHAAQLARKDSEQLAIQLEQQKTASEQSLKEIVAMKDDEIARIRDMRAKLNTKLIGESLEQHCEAEFEKLRMVGFARAEFHKDNETVEGTKGDYIFRDFGEDGDELISIMFEMKNEEEQATHHRSNESHLKKLDADRRKKGCEYAVLVSTLEPESTLYNQGIVDLSWKYDKMYVIRPQFFIPLITLLRNMAQRNDALRVELKRARQESIDITNFETELDKFKVGFARNTEQASRKFADAIEQIDRAIANLEKVKESFRITEKHLNAANNKSEALTIKRLTRDAPMLRERFAELAEERKAERALTDGAQGGDADEGVMDDAQAPDAVEAPDPK